MDIVNKLRKEYIKSIRLPRKDYKTLQEYLERNGITCYNAKHDAEELCSALCREGVVDLVYSNDSDNLVFGCPILLRKITDKKFYDLENKKMTKICEICRYDNVLNEIEFNDEQFTEFCIMLGCDFNERMKGARTGPVTCHKLITNHKSINNLPEKYEKYKHYLNYDSCKAIFNFKHSSELIDF